MILTQIRLIVALARPAVLFLLAVFAAIGMRVAGSDDWSILARVLAVVVGFLVFSVVCNDLADQAIDAVNLPGANSRPLVSGDRRRDMALVGGGAAAVSIATSLTLHWTVTTTVVAGMAVSAGYSLRPVRFAERGAVAALLLPACYVAVPFLIGHYAVTTAVETSAWMLLAGLYVGFIGRIVLKDFRDVRGDAMFGKRTFLVRHGRLAACRFSAAFWMVGTAMVLLALDDRTPYLSAGFGLGTMFVLILLRGLSVDGGPRRDEAIISGVAVIGRGLSVTLLAHFALASRSLPVPLDGAIISLIVAYMLIESWQMVRYGPRRVSRPDLMTDPEHAAR